MNAALASHSQRHNAESNFQAINALNELYFCYACIYRSQVSLSDTLTLGRGRREGGVQELASHLQRHNAESNFQAINVLNELYFCYEYIYRSQVSRSDTLTLGRGGGGGGVQELVNHLQRHNVERTFQSIMHSMNSTSAMPVYIKVQKVSQIHRVRDCILTSWPGAHHILIWVTLKSTNIF